MQTVHRELLNAYQQKYAALCFFAGLTKTLHTVSRSVYLSFNGCSLSDVQWVRGITVAGARVGCCCVCERVFKNLMKCIGSSLMCKLCIEGLCERVYVLMCVCSSASLLIIKDIICDFFLLYIDFF